MATLAEFLGAPILFCDGDWVESKDQDQNGDVRLIQLADIGDGDWLDKSSKFLTSEKSEQLRCTELKAGDLLISRMAEPLGRTCLFPGSDKKCVTVVDVCIIRVDPTKVCAKYLMYMLNSPACRQEMLKFATGTTRQRISRRNLEKIEVLALPLDKQEQIAAILDKATNLKAKAELAMEELDKLQQSVFLDMFGDPVTNPRAWPMSRLDALGDWMTGGTPARSSPEFFTGDIPWFSSGELNDMFVSCSSEQITEEAIARTAAKLIEPGSLMIGMYDTAAFKTSIAKSWCSCNQAIAFSKLDTHKASPIYLYFAIQIGREFFMNLRRGVRQRNLNLSLIRALSLPLPSIEMQELFEARIKKIRILKETCLVNGKTIDELFRSLQHRAFKGEV